MMVIGFVRATQFQRKHRETVTLGARDVIQVPDQTGAEILLNRNACDLSALPVNHAWGIFVPRATVMRIEDWNTAYARLKAQERKQKEERL